MKMTYSAAVTTRGKNDEIMSGGVMVSDESSATPATTSVRAANAKGRVVVACGNNRVLFGITAAAACSDDDDDGKDDDDSNDDGGGDDDDD